MSNKMPTSAERPDRDLDSLHVTLQESFRSWTDGLPICLSTEVGVSTNQVYQPNGVSKEEHEFEDRSFHYCLEDSSFYGVFDGRFGSRAVEFLSQRMPPEILLGQLKDKSDVAIKELLHQAFLSLETAFFQTIDNLLAEKEDLKSQLQGHDPIEAMKLHSNTIRRLNAVTAEIKSGTSAVVAVIFRNHLYIANVGDCRAVLCRTEDDTNGFSSQQLTIDHNFKNDDELLRLSQVGISEETLRRESRDRPHELTRCIGNYTTKGGYKEFENLSEALEEPVIAEPEVIGGIPLDDTCKFLLLMSGGLCRTLEQTTDADNVNSTIVDLLNKQLSKPTSLNHAVQAVVDEIGELHYNSYMKHKTKNLQKRNDITLLVRSFNKSETPARAVDSGNNTLEPMGTNDEDPSQKSNSHSSNHISSCDLTPDDDGRIAAYVDFSEFYAAVEEAYKRGEVPEDWREW